MLYVVCFGYLAATASLPTYSSDRSHPYLTTRRRLPRYSHTKEEKWRLALPSLTFYSLHHVYNLFKSYIFINFNNLTCLLFSLHRTDCFQSADSVISISGILFYSHVNHIGHSIEIKTEQRSSSTNQQLFRQYCLVFRADVLQ